MAETLTPGPPAQAGIRRALSGLGLLALLASALFGGNALGVRERFLGSETPEARPAAVSRGSVDTRSVATTSPPKETVLRSQPWWQGVTKLEGVGPTTVPLTIEAGAIQWRVKATCESGSLLVRAGSQARQVLGTSCPGTQTGFGTRTGALSLEVTAEGPWQMEVDQQVDVPLQEPPLPAMGAAGTVAVASGPLYRVDQVGTGTVTVYRLAGGGYALRLDDFFVTANTDLELQLSPLAAPSTTAEVTNARSGTIASLDVTAGSLNFAVPAGLDPTTFGSLVIWCERTRNAYAAASLKPA